MEQTIKIVTPWRLKLLGPTRTFRRITAVYAVVIEKQILESMSATDIPGAMRIVVMGTESANAPVDYFATYSISEAFLLAENYGYETVFVIGNRKFRRLAGRLCGRFANISRWYRKVILVLIPHTKTAIHRNIAS